MSNDPSSATSDPPPYAKRFVWRAPLPTPQTWKKDAKAIENVYAQRLHATYNEVHDTDRRWAKLPAVERERAWALRGQSRPDGDLTLWEQRAAIHEAYQRAALHAASSPYPAYVPRAYVEVERVPARLQAVQGGPYAYTVWTSECIGGGISRSWPHAPDVAANLDDLRAVVAHTPRDGPSFPVVVFTEDVALRQQLRAHDIPLGRRYSPEMAQERREFYTLEAQHAVREARSTRDWIEADWHELTPSQQQAAYVEAGQGDTATLWEHRLAAQLKLARREQVIPYASRSGHQLPEVFVEVEAKAGRTAPYRVTRWTRVWDTDVGLTRYAHDAPQRVPTLEAVAEAAQDGQVPIFVDTLGMRAQLQQHGLTVVAQEHMAMQRPSVERSQDHERGHGLGA